MRIDQSLLYRALVTVAALQWALLAAPPASAQKPPSPDEVERRKAMGGYHPERMKNPNLTGHAGKMTATAPEDIPLRNLQVPAGFQVELWAHGNPGARMMTRGDR